MDAFSIGALFGRLFASYLIVLLVLFLFNRKLLTLVFLSALLSLSAIGSASAERQQRAMQVHKEKDMGLEIWTENSPQWIVEKRFIGKRPVLFAQSPPNVYPPASMSVISYAGMVVQEDDFAKYAEVALSQGLEQYGLSQATQDDLIREPKQYGELVGIELNFAAKVHGSAADVKIFMGRGGDKGPVLLQIHTPKGKMAHVSEQVRRSWSNIKYL